MEEWDMAALVRHNTTPTPPAAAAEGLRSDAARNRLSDAVYTHHVPGRLRLKAEAFRGHPTVLEAVRREIVVLHGVTSVAVNPHTGSLIVEYDPRASTTAALCEALQSIGLPDACVAAMTDRAASFSEHQAEIAIGRLLGWLVERLAVGLFAAVI
jgi:hypothetical protein